MQDAIGRQERATDTLDLRQARHMQLTLDQAPTLQAGDPLPPFFHQIHFWDAQPPGALGRDGHPKVGGLIPDMGLPRRMWAGARLTFHKSLLAGQAAEKVTVVESAVRKASPLPAPGDPSVFSRDIRLIFRPEE